MNSLDFEELRWSGLLQEANRQFFHPRGLSLVLIVEDGAEPRLVIQDGRDDPEGWEFEWGAMTPAARAEVRTKARLVEVADERVRPFRLAGLGFWVQPLPTPRRGEAAVSDPSDPRLASPTTWTCHLCGEAVLDPARFSGGPHEGELVQALRAHAGVCSKRVAR